MAATTQPIVASKTKRFFAFAIDQTVLTLIGLVMFVAVFSTQTQQLSNATNAFFGDPVWSQIDKLSSEAFNSRVDDLMASPKVVSSVEALAHPFAVALGLSLLLSAIYYIVPTQKWGATLGKYWLKINVRTLEGELPDIWQSTGRYFAFIGLGTFGGIVTLLDLAVNKAFIPSNSAVDILTILLSQATWVLSMVSVVLIFARVDRRGLHDLFAKTIVYSVSKEQKSK